MSHPEEQMEPTQEAEAPGYEWQDLGETTAALAAMGQFAPQADLPNLGPSREAGRV